MKALIVEDEVMASDRLVSLLSQVSSDIHILDTLDSVKSTVKWLKENTHPDVLFLDIQLADGKSFEILEQTEVKCPIIFTTAYDQYAIEAFKVNSIDYLLKPIVPAQLEKAIEKLQSRINPQIDSQKILDLLSQQTKKYKERFVVKIGEHLRFVQASEVGLFFTQDKATYLVTHDGQRVVIDYSMDQLGELIDPSNYFRISRKYFVHIDSIEDIITYSNSRLRLMLRNHKDDDIIVSRERVGQFKSWLDR